MSLPMMTKDRATFQRVNVTGDEFVNAIRKNEYGEIDTSQIGGQDILDTICTDCKGNWQPGNQIEVPSNSGPGRTKLDGAFFADSFHDGKLGDLVYFNGDATEVYRVARVTPRKDPFKSSVTKFTRYDFVKQDPVAVRDNTED